MCHVHTVHMHQVCHIKHLLQHIMGSFFCVASRLTQLLFLQPVLKLSPDQVTDLMTLRRFFYCKLGQLARFRRDVLTKMTWSQVDSSHCSDKLSSLSAWAEHLQENGAEEYRTYMQWARANFRGVRCSHVAEKMAC